MQQIHSILVAAGPICLLAVGAIPTRWANAHPQAMRMLAPLASAAALILALIASALLAWRGSLDATFLRGELFVPLTLGVYFDGLAAVLLLLVSFIGAIITRYSLRYLDGDPTQGRFLRWISFTLGSALLLVVSRNLLMFTSAWVLTSFGLHQLLTHYANRPGAILAARKKFLISRLGDAMLVAAILLTCYVFGSLEYTDLFAAAAKLHADAGGFSWPMTLIGTLFVLGAMTKSAQFPFHSWLPDTMETPTPVSALMHAGIINAGGFLVIRLSPLISLSELALHFLALVGALTAVFGAVVMLTQSSIKRSLAYSTIAQMGFMMLQCGLGAFSAALLHIVAHSVYKAHAFLNSGSVLDAAAKLSQEPAAPRAVPRSRFALLGCALAAAGVVYTIADGAGAFATGKPGGLLLGFILAIAITQLLWKATGSGRLRVIAAAALAAVLVAVSYHVAYLLMDRVLAASMPRSSLAAPVLDYLSIALVALGFLGIFALQLGWESRHQPAWLRALYVHASNGFYFDIAVQKVTLRLWERFSSAN